MTGRCWWPTPVAASPRSARALFSLHVFLLQALLQGLAGASPVIPCIVRQRVHWPSVWCLHASASLTSSQLTTVLWQRTRCPER